MAYVFIDQQPNDRHLFEQNSDAKIDAMLLRVVSIVIAIGLVIQAEIFVRE